MTFAARTKRRMAWYVFALVAAVLVGAAVITTLSFHRLTASLDTSNETHATLFRTERAMTLLEHAVSAKRAFLLTHDSSYLDASRELLRRVDRELAEIAPSLTDDPGDAALNARLNLILTDMHARMLAVASADANAETMTKHVNADRANMEELRALIENLERTDLSRAQKHERVVKSHADVALQAAGAGSIMVVALIAFSLMTLRRQIAERARAQDALTNANVALKTKMGELELHAQESLLLSDLGEILQVCPSIEETSKVLPLFMTELFPASTGAIYSLKESRNQLDVIGTWGGATMPDTFDPADCWALRKGRMHVIGEGPMLICEHNDGVPPLGSMCVPMMRHGDAIGIVHLRPADALDGKLKIFAKTVADQVSLALANLRLQESLRTRAVRDPLTGLFNRRYMEESLEREIRRSGRKGTAAGVMMLDVDHFKHFNDTFGHAGGDALLQNLATLMSSMFREEDIVCRYGGEEFAVILAETDEGSLLQRAEELRMAVKTLHVRLNGQPLGRITMSIGAALSTTHGATVDSLLAAADHALYQAKQAGRDRVVSASERPELHAVS
ncbi:MAG TPA: diguanylate cyclase [Thermoanaerobaculia bacterium]|nr:diguanylate cyclase [Thermoanaerobaculia bacterium]